MRSTGPAAQQNLEPTEIMVSAPARVQPSVTASSPRRRFRPVPADLALIAVAVGIGLRLWHWLQDAPYWLDEQMIAVNVRDSGFTGLAGSLTFHQSAPLGWLWLERVCYLIAGGGERSLRLVPLLLGVGVLVTAWLAGRRWLGAAGTVVLCTLLAVSPSLIRYSGELKQYSGDAFATLLMLVLAVAALGDRRRTVIWWLAAAAVSTISMSAILAAPAMALLLTVAIFRRYGWRGAIASACWGLVWLAAVAGHYLVSLRYTTGEGHLKPWWTARGGMPASLGDVWQWLIGRPAGIATDPLHLPEGTLAAFWFLALAGIAVLLRGRPMVGLLVASPLVTGLLLGAVRAVPLASRLALWLVPVILVAVAVAVDALARTVAGSGFAASWVRPRDAEPPRPVPAVLSGLAAFALVGAVALTGMVVTPQAAKAGEAVVAPDGTDDRAALEWIAARHRAGDLTLITVSSIPGVRWYADVRDLRPGRFVRAVAPGNGCDETAIDQAVLGHRRLLVYSGIVTQPATPAVLEAHLRRLGRIVETRQWNRVSRAWVVELSPGAPTPAAQDPALATQPTRCLQLSSLG